MSGSRQTSSAGTNEQATNSVAPFKERLSSTSSKATGSTPTKPKPHAAGTSTSLTAAKQQQQQQQRHEQQLQPAITPYNSRQPKSKALQPISAVHAVAKVAAAEAAVSAAAAVLVPSKASIKQASTAPPKAAHSTQQQKHTQVKDSSIGLQAAPAEMPCLQVEGTHTGPRRNSGPGAMRRTTAEAATATTSSACGSLLQASLQVSTTGGPSAAVGQSAPGQQAIKHGPAQPSTHDKHAAQLLQTQELLQTLALAGAGAGSATAAAPSAAAQLAAYGLTKRIRAQLRSAHGPPPFQRSALPRPASPPPVDLDADMLMACNPDASSPEGVSTADLSSCSISSIPQPSAVHTVLGNQQLSLQSFPNLVSLDLSDNRLRCFAGLAVLPSLQQLSLSANRLRDLQGLWQTADAEQHSSGADQQTADAEQQQPVSSATDTCTTAADEQQVQQEASTTATAESGGPEADADTALLSRDSTSCEQGADAEVAEQRQPMEQLKEQPSADCEQGQQSEACEQQQHQMLDQLADDSHAAESGADQQLSTAGNGALDSLVWQASMLTTVPGFTCLEELDLSYNLLSREQLLGQTSPLGVLPRLSELHAAGNSLTSLPAQPGPFSSLTLLNLQHNQLNMASIVPLGQLPVLQHLDLSHNPLAGPAHCAPAQHIAAAQAAGQAGCTDASTAGAPGSAQEAGMQNDLFVQLQVLDLSSSKVKQVQPLQELLGCMQELAVLRLEHTPLAECCRAGKVQEQELLRPALEVILYHSAGRQQAAQHGKHSLAVGQVPVLKIPEAATPSKVLAAAIKAALVSLSHDQLVAAFDRVSAGIDNWQQLAPVIEEPPEDYWDWQDEGSGVGSSAGPQQRKQVTVPVDDEKIEDKTFLTGVGITGELPDDESWQDATSSQGPSDQSEDWQDPTERLALALGLQVSQLAHMSGCIPGNPDAALHRLRHALSHPLVDPDAGHRPQQHHMRSTAATAAKQHHSKPAPLPQPISSALSTRVEPVQDLGMLLKNMRGRLTAMQGTLLPQLQAQANKMAPGTVGKP